MNKTKYRKPIWWSGLLLILATGYLLPEAVFNSLLVEVAGSGKTDMETLRQVELFGRTISGIGVTLMILDFIGGRWVQSPWKALGIFMLVLIVVWPCVFFGQKRLIEIAVIEPSTPEQRQHAFMSAMLRSALASNAIQIHGVDFNADHKSSPSEMTFLALFGGLVYADTKLTSAIEDKKRNILLSFIKSKAYSEFDSYYDRYNGLYDILAKHYKDYAAGSKKYSDALNSHPKRSATYWAEIETNLDKGWSDFQAAKKAHFAKAEARAQKFGPKIYEHFEHVNNKCLKNRNKESRDKCLLNANVKYKDMINQAGLGYIEPDYWLKNRKVSTSENVTNTLIKGVSSLGTSLLIQAIDAAMGGNGGFVNQKYSYTNNVEHYRERFLAHPKFDALFTKQTGYPYSIKLKTELRNHPKTSEKAIKALAEKGLVLPKNWTLNDRSTFDNAVAKKIPQAAKAVWKKEMRKHGLTMPPNLQWEEWQLHSDIQSRIKERMGKSYVKGMLAGWNKKTFKQKVIDPNIQRTLTEALERIDAAKDEFADGGRYAHLGKQSLRSVLIPPISMFLSLFLVCLTATKLPFKYWDFLVTWYRKPIKLKKGEEGHVNEALTAWRRNQKPSSVKPKSIDEISEHQALNPASSKKSKLFLTFSKLAVALSLVILLPIFAVSSTYTQKGSTVLYFLDQVEKESNPIFSKAIYWVIHAQPIMQPLGADLNKALGVTDKFKPIAAFLDQWDEKHENDTTDHVVKNMGKAFLTVATLPKKAKVRIMNIKPKYHDELVIEPGNYDIEVSSPGYKTKRTWHRVLPGEQTINVVLIKSNTR